MQEFCLDQPVTFDSVVQQRQVCETVLLNSDDGLHLTFDAAIAFDSALLSLILCLQRSAQAQKKRLMVQVPDRLKQVANVYGLMPVFEKIISD